ncbi:MULTISPECIES: DciA family protein [unclassified Borrelia]|uniref:DciA family protein n=1 Tax=unclassified Borrelia TaxID=2649934 RepID=UPI001E55F304|nr:MULTISPECIES: DciA family protein [unclassified Borrelia]UGQ16118.1 DciA family protein [Borrelia sp. RT5S]UGQ17231.1 DciA family protein [Borrelia sp. RT1S]
MEDLNFKRVSDVLNKYLSSDIIPNKNLNDSLVLSQNWKTIFGELSGSVKLLNLKDNKVLYIGVKNSSVLYSISLQKSKIIKLIRDSTGIEIVDITVLIK